MQGAKGTFAAKQLLEAREELDELGQHELQSTHASSELIARARMAIRLLAYSLARPNLEEQSQLLGSNGAVFTLSEHYVSDGGYVDFARERARGAGDNELETAIEAVIARLDAIREKDDEAFARAYSSWASAGSPPSQHVVPIAKGLDRFAADFLKDRSHRRLLVILLDGMSWANAVELLQDCEAKNYAPLRVGKIVPMLAALPSLTGVSRSALFGGKPIKAGESLDTAKDPERFATHAGLRRIGIENAPLYLKEFVETSSGDLNPKAIELVRSAERIVGLVVNALDDQLKGARQIRVPSDLSHIKPLARLLSEAAEANRAVLLIADHGHVRSDRMRPVGRPGDGRRYRALAESETPESYEVVVSKDVAWVERGKSKVAMLYRDSDSYGTATHTGEHGGISLAEIVAPAILIGSDTLRRRVEVAEGKDDPELDVAPLPRPDWWELRPPPKAREPKSPAPPPVVSKTRKDTPPKGQAALPGILDKPAVIEPTLESEWLTNLRASKAFGGRSVEQLKRFREVVAPRLAVLADTGGAMPSDVFARKVGVLPRNVGGVVSEMQEWVNFDGYLIVEHDPISRRLLLRLDMLSEYIKELG
jgi:hypothetical protein